MLFYFLNQKKVNDILVKFTMFEHYMRLWMEKENVDSDINPQKSGKNKVKKYQ